MLISAIKRRTMSLSVEHDPTNDSGIYEHSAPVLYSQQHHRLLLKESTVGHRRPLLPTSPLHHENYVVPRAWEGSQQQPCGTGEARNATVHRKGEQHRCFSEMQGIP